MSRIKSTEFFCKNCYRNFTPGQHVAYLIEKHYTVCESCSAHENHIEWRIVEDLFG
ncbi:hypothetical protein [Pseudalkalibacillus hwajinpoensis]|uniref:hypothetical protein n=1 Tax=Guptibacillus hwajinpoensis TaxID=208199 RepID=UPI001CFE9C59|nr:hypothetical protein [Pseudalkalibacillus hwajinpoensis]